jgi:hypothetical protein
MSDQPRPTPRTDDVWNSYVTPYVRRYAETPIAILTNLARKLERESAAREEQIRELERRLERAEKEEKRLLGYLDSGRSALKIRSLREALRPFANYACNLEPGESCQCHNCIARQALEETNTPT